jgi:hypothetical protein
MANKLPKPEKGDKPKKITTKNKPGGSKTPGAKDDKFNNQTTDSNNSK